MAYFVLSSNSGRAQPDEAVAIHNGPCKKVMSEQSVMSAANKTSFLDLLRLHQELDELFLSHQLALLSLELHQAGEILGRYERKLLSHMRNEEELLIPIYEARTAEIAGGAVELFLGEHKRMKEFLAAFHDLLGRMKDEDATRLKRSLIDLLDRQSMYKRLVEHHDLREQNILYPWLDRVTSDKERADLLALCMASNSG